MEDMAASVLARLKIKAKTMGISYQQCLQLFFQEEFLRKLSASRYGNNFILKGGFFIYTLTNFESRATVDVDLLARGISNDMKNMDRIIAEILAIYTGNDYVIFKAEASGPIALQREYHGVRVRVTGYIKNVRVPFDIDIGVGDVIVPGASKRTISTQLPDFAAPEVMTYSLESTIAEKLEAMLQRYELTSRMKDFYDIYYLSQRFDFEGKDIQRAIIESLSNRGTVYNAESFNRIKRLAEDEAMQVKWRYFIKTIHNPDISFETVMDGIARFIEPVWESILKKETFAGYWQADKKIWS